MAYLILNYISSITFVEYHIYLYSFKNGQYNYILTKYI